MSSEKNTPTPMNVAAASYQNATSTTTTDNDETEKLVQSEQNNNGTYSQDNTDNAAAASSSSRQNRFSMDDRPSSSSLSEEGMNSTDYHFRMNDYRASYISLFWKKFGSVGGILMIMLCGIMLVVVVTFMIVTTTMASSKVVVTVPPPSIPCGSEPSPIMALKESSTLEGAPHGIVASDHPQCSQLGLSILQEKNGNAVDAAVTTALCLGIANPASSGIGGGAFILIHADMVASPDTKNNIHHHPSYPSPTFVDARDDTTTTTATTTTTTTTHNNKDDGSSDKVTEVIDCRETAPSGATTDMYINKTEDASTVGGLAIGVPGELRGLELAHARHGRLSWKDVLEPAIQLARHGVRVGSHLALDIAEHFEEGENQFPELAKLLTKNQDGHTLLQEGDVMTNPALADTLEAVSIHGTKALYEGTRAKQMAQDIQNAGGIITEEDIRNYRPTLRSPLIGRNIKGFTIVGTPPPSSGGAAVIGAARFLSGYQTPQASFADTLSQHRIAESTRHAFAIRMSLSDPDYNADVVRDAVNDLVYTDVMESLRQITKDNETLPLSHYGGKRWAQLHDDDGQGEGVDAHEGDRRRRRRRRLGGHTPRKLVRRFGYLEDHGTSHLSIVDKDGNAVSFTSSVNLHFGSGIVSPSTGVLFNDQMDDFSSPGLANHFGLKPSKANYIKPGKKPLSSMSPTMVFAQREDSSEQTNGLGDLFMVVGASGGPKIITAVLSAIVNHAFMGMPLFESMAHPRIHDQLLYHNTAATAYEEAPLGEGRPTIQVTNRTVAALKKRGHQVLAIDYTGCVQAVAVDLETKRLSAVSDIRKGGMPAGY